jgi:hypothetical protein
MKEELFRQMISSIAEARKHRAGKPSKARVTVYADTINCGFCPNGKATIVRGPLPSKCKGVKLTLQNIERYRCPECDEEFFSVQQCRAVDAARKKAYRRQEAFEKLHADLSKEFAQQVRELNRVKNVFAFHVNSDMMAVNRTDEEAVLSVVFYRFNHTVHFHYVGKVVFCRVIEVRSAPTRTYMCWGYTDSPNELCNKRLPENKVVDFVREAVNALISVDKERT